MNNNDDKSYKRYKQYQMNKHRYKEEQFLIPATIIICGATLMTFWKQILIAIVAICIVGIIAVVIYRYLKKQLNVEHPIVISPEDAKNGVNFKMNVTYDSQRVSFNYDVPANVKSGEKFVAKNILFENKKGKKIKKNVHFVIQISN